MKLETIQIKLTLVSENNIKHLQFNIENTNIEIATQKEIFREISKVMTKLQIVKNEFYMFLYEPKLYGFKEGVNKWMIKLDLIPDIKRKLLIKTINKTNIVINEQLVVVEDCVKEVVKSKTITVDIKEKSVKGKKFLKEFTEKSNKVKDIISKFIDK